MEIVSFPSANPFVNHNDQLKNASKTRKLEAEIYALHFRQIAVRETEFIDECLMSTCMITKSWGGKGQIWNLAAGNESESCNWQMSCPTAHDTSHLGGGGGRIWVGLNLILWWTTNGNSRPISAHQVSKRFFLEYRLTPVSTAHTHTPRFWSCVHYLIPIHHLPSSLIAHISLRLSIHPADNCTSNLSQKTNKSICRFPNLQNLFKKQTHVAEKKYLLQKKKPKPKSLPYLFFIHIFNSPTCLTPKKNIDPLNPFAKWFSGFFFHFCFQIISFLLFIFCNPLFEVVVVRLPVPTPYHPEWVVWDSMCLVFFVERFLCDIFIGGNRIFCVKFPKNETFNCLFFVCHFLIGCKRSIGVGSGKKRSIISWEHLLNGYILSNPYPF